MAQKAAYRDVAFRTPLGSVGAVAILLLEAVASIPHTQPFKGDGCVLEFVLPDFFLSVVQTLLGFCNWQVVGERGIKTMLGGSTEIRM